MSDTPQLHLDNQLCFRLYTASRLITQAYEPLLKPLGITYTQYLVLMVLWQDDHQPVSAIGARLQLGINTMSPLIRRMEKEGLVERVTSKDDKRVQVVSLTQRGRDLKEQAATVPGCMVEAMNGSGVDTACLPELVPMLDNIITHMGSKNQ